MVAETRLRDEIDEMLPGVIADRRDFHEHPELAYHEERTAGIVADRLRALGLDDIRAGIAGTGVTGLIHGRAGGSGRVVLLRADMDALPIHEQNDVDYRSRTEGVMHACGHDAHTAMLLAVARLLMDRRGEFSGTVKALFQPAEELPPGGAKPMIDAGVLEDPHVDAVFGLHIDQNSPLGVVSVRPGPYMAAADRFTIALKGKGGHGAHPHDTVDPVLVGAQIVTALQSLVSREINPISSGVVSVTAFLAGDAFNVIPDTAELRGTVRTFTPENRDLLEKRIGELVTGIASAMRAEAAVDYNRGYPSTVNDPAMTEIVRQAAIEAVGADHVRDGEPMMGAEDFSYFLQARPGSFFFVGSRNDERGLVWGHHHPRFDLDEAALAVGVETMTRVALDYLNEPA
ncbi:MAG TPA: amidohydrolase [Thermomicrobiales bacterium]|nr:amidohydrolase [Thermomicrobiales bacterium]